MVLTRRRMALVVAVGCVALAACGDSGSSSDTTDAATTAPPATDAATTIAPVSTDAPTTVGEPVSAATPTDTGYSINWAALTAVPFYGQTGGGDPYFNIHTIPASDGFFFSLELYTVYGTAWTGELGVFDIGCSPTSTGICAHFDPDGPGPLTNLGADFLATGSVTITQLDADGYDVVVDELVFSDGTTITGLHLVG